MPPPMDSIVTLTPVCFSYSEASFFSCESTSILPLTRRSDVPDAAAAPDPVSVTTELPDAAAALEDEELLDEEPHPASRDAAIAPQSATETIFLFMSVSSLNLNK